MEINLNPQVTVKMKDASEEAIIKINKKPIAAFQFCDLIFESHSEAIDSKRDIINGLCWIRNFDVI